jgi:hypothetical protein
MKILRNPKGAIATELSVGAMMLLTLSLSCLDGVFLLVGYWANDAACRDAARAGGTADTGETALIASRVACSTHSTDGFWFSQPQLSNALFKFGQGLPGPAPYVYAVTSCNVKVPALRLLMQANSDCVGIRRGYAFPALSLIEKPPTVTPIDLSALIGPNNALLPDTSGAIPGSGTSTSQQGGE